MEGQNHHKSGIEKDAFHNHIKTDEVFEESLDAFSGVGLEAVLHNLTGEAHLKVVLVTYGRDLVIHIEHLSLIEAQ